MKKYIIFLIVGIILFTLGGIQNTKYEEHSLKVDATITDIDTRDDTDSGYRHTYYGQYEVNGKVYSDVKLDTVYDSDYMPSKFVGDTISITVDPDKPNKKVAEGGFIITVGAVLSAYSIYKIIKIKKAKEETPC